VKLEWAAHAIEDRLAIFEYIEADDPRNAAIIDDRIRLQLQQLIRYPKSGRIGRVPGTRELVIGRTPYIAAYRIAGDTVRILRVLHGAQQWPDALLQSRD
jgi:addiction module RelE/StbE family toxin